MEGKLKEDLLNKIQKNLEIEEMLLDYQSKLPENFELIENLGQYKNFKLADDFNIEDVMIVKIKNKEDNKELIKILSEKFNKDFNKKELEEIATIDEKGKIELAETIEKTLSFYDKDFVNSLKEKSDICLEKTGKESLKLNDKENMKQQEDKEKNDIARSIGEQDDDILNIVRINDKDAGSKLFDVDMNTDSKIDIVRLRNNKFKILKENGDGTYSELKGYEVTPILEGGLFDAIANIMYLKNKLNEGTIEQAGKSKSQNKYNLFIVKGKGDTGQGNKILYLGVDNKSQIDVIDNRDKFGGIKLEETDISDIYPKKIIMNGKEVTVKEKPVEEEKQKECNMIDNSYKDYIYDKHELKKELLEIEEKIDKILDTDENTEELDELYSRRTEILAKLNINEKFYVQELDRHEDHEHNFNNHGLPTQN